MIIPEDLELLAMNVDEWPKDSYWGAWLSLSEGGNLKTGFFGWPEDLQPQYTEAYTRDQWKAARRELGLDKSLDEATPQEWDAASRAVGWGQPTEEEEEAFNEMEKKHLESMATMGGPDAYHKQTRYLDKEGRDWIDECAATMTVDEFRGAMKFTIGKYVRRAGKKDALESEIRKIEDYARRWAEYEKGIVD